MKNILMKILSFFAGGSNGNPSANGYTRGFTSAINDIDSYTDMVRDVSVETKQTTVGITYSSHLSFGMHSRSFIRKLGRPRHSIQQKEPFERKVLLYKFMMGGHKTRCELHFYRDKLFFFNYTFPYILEEDKLEILNILCFKYLGGGVKVEHCKIMDKNNNIIFIDDTGALSVNYLAADSELFTGSRKTKSKREIDVFKKKRFYETELLRML
jgi:hypothetical protein